jgi:hypothetical protein
MKKPVEAQLAAHQMVTAVVSPDRSLCLEKSVFIRGFNPKLTIGNFGRGVVYAPSASTRSGSVNH